MFKVMIQVLFLKLFLIVVDAQRYLYEKCGGIGYTGSTVCVNSICFKQNDYYSQCLTSCPSGWECSSSSSSTTTTTTTTIKTDVYQVLYGQCGGIGWTGQTNCENSFCFKQNDYYFQCLTSCPSGWECSLTTITTTKPITTRISTTTTKPITTRISTTTKKPITTRTSTTTKKPTTTTKISTTTRTSTTTKKPTTTTKISTTTLNSKQVLNGQCGGKNWTGPINCVNSTCYRKDDFFSQCLISCPTGWACVIKTTVSTSNTTIISPTQKINSTITTSILKSTSSSLTTSSSIIWQTGDWAFGCDFTNNDLSNVQTTGANCGQTCYNNPQCTHFTWTTYNGGTCWLKYGPISKTDALKTNDNSMVCGIVRPTPSGSTTTLSSFPTNSQTTVTDRNNNFTQNYSTIFPYCKFRFGYAYSSSPFDYSIVDYITIWIGWNQFNQYWEGDMLKKCVSYSKIPVFYAYFIAFMSRQDWNLQDCNVGSPSLCQKGAEYIRQYRTSIVNNYKSYATSIANIIGVNSESIWLIEPDFWQYYGDFNQVNGPLSGNYMRSFFDDIASAIKSQLPNARISWDISAWIGESGMKTWWSYFSSSPYIDYIHTSGGESRAELTQIKPNEISWSFMSTLTGKKIIADTGYGVGGGGTGHNTAYDNYNNLVSRINDGVVAVSQVSADSSWGSILNNLRLTLPSVCPK